MLHKESGKRRSEFIEKWPEFKCCKTIRCVCNYDGVCLLHQASLLNACASLDGLKNDEISERWRRIIKTNVEDYFHFVYLCDPADCDHSGVQWSYDCFEDAFSGDVCGVIGIPALCKICKERVIAKYQYSGAELIETEPERAINNLPEVIKKLQKIATEIEAGSQFEAERRVVDLISELSK